MDKTRPSIVAVVAILQFIPPLLLPPRMLLSASPLVLAAPLVLFAFLGWAMLALKPWAKTLCIFVQGFSVIARFLIMFPQASPGESTDWAFVLTSLLSIGLSTVILYVIDKPQVQVAFQA